MSNHAGSYMLNEVLRMLEERGVFTQMGPAAAQKLVLDIVKRSREEYDCNSGEILDQIGARLGICSCCAKASAELVDGTCPKCRAM
jgi:hypothetical protein